MLTVALFGTSLTLASIGAALEGHTDLRVVRLDPSLCGIAEMQALAPDVVVIDLATAQPQVLAFCKSIPHVLLIGLDLNTDTALVLTGAPVRLLSTHDLANVIEHQFEHHDAGEPPARDATG